MTLATMKKELTKLSDVNESVFESIKHLDENGMEFWYARELMMALGYKRWDKFSNVIDSAKTACMNSNCEKDDHFSQVGKMVEIGSKTTRKVLDLDDSFRKDKDLRTNEFRNYDYSN